ncbi:MAG TPA: AAA family ATPase, partial [Candidatus Eisenbacteria bacterium]|nr:AAA family ATPase [Candidatus Eisenbacteria bacterium]
RHQSVIKLEATRENLQQAEMLLAEIEPRMRSLARQVKRLEERGSLEEELHALKHQYYGDLWHDLKKQMDARKATLDSLEKEWHEKESTLDAAKAELASLEQAETGIDGFSELQADYEKLLEEKNRLRSQELQVKSKIEIAEQVKKRVASTMPLSKIIEEIGRISSRQEALIGKLKAAKSLEDAQAVVPELDALRKDTTTLRERLERPAPESSAPAEHDPALMKELAALADGIAASETKIREAQGKLQAYNQGEQKKKEKFFSLQRSLQEKIGTAHALERRLGDERVEQARLDTRREALEQEMAAELGEKAQHVRESYTPTEGGERPEAVLPQIQKLKYQLQLIGGIDTEVVKEYEETKGRFDFLDGQTTDLRKAIDDLDHVIAELDVTIKARSESAFRQLNRDFDRYFKTLFGGGHAELIQLREEPKDEDDEDAAPEDAAPKEEKKEYSDHIVGIDIHATPPGKKIKNIAMLSGGERALISIALICAIMTSNPSPFVVLDEVDAALDESNADKFASIIEQLAEKTQFIVITHNRYTMRKANVLYGVTMRQDGTSMLLSINLDEAGNLKNESKTKMTV